MLRILMYEDIYQKGKKSKQKHPKGLFGYNNTIQHEAVAYSTENSTTADKAINIYIQSQELNQHPEKRTTGEV